MSGQVRIKARGPIVVEGDIEVLGPDGQPLDRAGLSRLLLCRCGASKVKPRCDGSHHRVRFEVDDAPGESST